MAEIVLTKEQQAVIDNRGGTLLVSAAAGSGKTKVLIDRVLKRVEQGGNVDDFLLITFTQAAAAELRGKMIARLNELLSQNPNDRHLLKQMTRVYLEKISTVHSFCGSILREYAHLLDIPADFRTAEDSESNLLQDSAMKNMLEQAYRTLQDDEKIMAALDMLGAGRDDMQVSKLIYKVYESVQCWAEPKKRIEQLRQSIYVENCDDPVQTVWGAYLLEELKKALEGYVASIERASELIRCDDLLQPYAQNFEDDLRIIHSLAEVSSWREISQIPCKFSRLKTVKKCNNEDAQLRIKQIRKTVKEDLTERIKDFLLPCDELLSDIAGTAKAIDGLLTLVELFEREYRKQKMRRRILDYNDLEHEAFRLLVHRNGQPTSAAKEIAERFTEIMVDEYQDTNGVQDAIFGALAYRGNLFMVGDVKQSIYRFRMADPTGFLNRYKAYADYKEAEEGQPRKILLSDNFRSCPEVLEAANDVFRLLMSPNVGGLHYGEAEALKPNMAEHGDMPIELHCIDLRDVPSELHLSGDEIEAQWIAKRIRKMLDEGETIRLRDGERKIETQDITILMRGVKNSAPTYISALAQHGIRCICGNENLLETQEISTLVSLLKVIDNPHQDIALLSVLFSPLFCFSAEDMAQLRAADKFGDLYDILQKSEKGRRAIETISHLRDIAAQSNLHTLLDEIDETLYLRALYPNCEHNFDQLWDIADRYEASDRHGLSGFLRYLQIQKEKGVSSEQPSQKGAVRLLTMHKSKGLEFPVVFLAGLNKRFNDRDLYVNVLVDPKLGIGSKLLDTENNIIYSTIARNAIYDRMKKENRSEEMRVLYVAMTRAQCRLIMTCCGNGIERKLSDIATQMTVPALESYVGGASSLGDWILMTAMTRTEAGELFRVGGNPFVSNVSKYPWKIQYHKGEGYLPQPMDSGRAERKSAQPPCLTVPLYAHGAACAYPSKLTATQLKGRVVDEELPHTALYSTALRFTKPSFDKKLSSTERGTAMHLAMEHLPYDAMGSEESIRRELERLVSMDYMTEEQASAVSAEQLMKFYASPIGQRVRLAGNLVREFKFSVLEKAERYDKALQAEEILLQGVADCALIEEDGLVIIDFKTDRIQAGEENERAETYRGQLAAYANALSRIFEKPVKECILYFFATGQSVSIS